MRTKKAINKLVEREKAGSTSETCSFKRDLVFKRETWRLADKSDYNQEHLQANRLTVFGNGRFFSEIIEIQGDLKSMIQS